MKKMPRLPVIFVLIILTFVGSNPVLLVEVPNTPEVAPAAVADVNAKIETTTILADNDSLTVASPVKPIKIKTESANDTKIAVPPKATDPPETVPQHIAKPNETEKHKKCNSTTELEDLQGCYVNTRPDSGEATDDITTQSVAESTIVNAVTEKTETNKTEPQLPEPSPDKTKKKGDKEKDVKEKDVKEKDVKKEEDKEKDDKGKDDKGKHDKGKDEKGKDEEKDKDVTIVLLNSTESTSEVSYETVSAKPNDVQNTNGTGGGPKPVTPPPTVNDTAMSNNSVVPLNKVESGGVVAEAKLADQNKSMPSGIIALVTAISFGVAIAIVYIGMIVWRRYVEYRYGHRELLVNELEFDTNDLRHFEL